ncbi:MAG: S41 family peptidase [Cyanobacteria bacterium J06560_2]
MRKETATQRLNDSAANQNSVETTTHSLRPDDKQRQLNAEKAILSIGSKVRAKAKANHKNRNKDKQHSGVSFLSATHPAVRSQLGAATELSDFYQNVGKLTLQHRRQIVEQALIVIKENFVHRPLKEAMHGVDPLQKLRLIQHRLEQVTPKTMGSELRFHRDMNDVFTSLRDLHTNYLLPAPFADKIAFLPFDIEECFAAGQAQYIASHFVPGFTHNYFQRGVTITSWNAIPIARAIEMSADQHAGSNLPARHAQGIDGLTVRALRRSLPPDELWVTVGYTDLQGKKRELKQPWLVTSLTPNMGNIDADTLSKNATCLGNDIQADLIQQAKKMLFAPEVIAKEKTREKNRAETTESSKHLELTSALVKVDNPDNLLETRLEGVFRAKRVTTAAGDYGYIRIFTFNVEDPDEFIDEFIRLAALLPQEGLVIDVRANGGGHIYASEGLLQVLTPGEITPEPTQFLNTPLNARICKRHEKDTVGIDLSPWVDSICNSVETGEIYSHGFPITPPEFANGRGQKYHGPVVLVTDARCYSATDIFAAGFKDHNIGHILGVDGNTGAGGANVWAHGLLGELLQVPEPVDAETPYRRLPHGASMRVAVRRTLRVGEKAGMPVEDLGVQPDSRHALTRNDLINGNEDLILAATEILKTMPSRGLTVSTKQSGSVLSVEVTTAGYSRLDVAINNRPVRSIDVNKGTHRFDVEMPKEAEILKLEGYEKGELVVANRISL